jgi:hypothetical protein
VLLNNGLTPATAANNIMIAQKTLPATTNNEAAAIAEQIIQLDLSLNAGYRLYVTLGTAVAAGYAVTAVAGDYS